MDQNDNTESWSIIWDSLLINFLTTPVGVADNKNETDIEPARIELYDEHYVMICKYYKGFICPDKYIVPTRKLVTADYQSNDIHNTLNSNIDYIYEETYYQKPDSCDPFLTSGKGIQSKNKRFKMYLSPSGNLIMKDGVRTIWESQTANYNFTVPPYNTFIDNTGKLIIRNNVKHIIFATTFKSGNKETYYPPFSFRSTVPYCNEKEKCASWTLE
ncbi:hypothetical protein H8356DRAFT_1341547 [Neocallimastix lanati (nom. inval.)]|nr:hypothetical protein H8356DRAFT_1341547 [Neocallimastix sp. JGI-2020a]